MKSNDRIIAERERAEKELLNPKTAKKARINRLDAIVIAAVTIVAALAAFIGLGASNSPVTFYESASAGDYIIFDKGTTQDRQISEVWMYVSGTSDTVGQIQLRARHEGDRDGGDENGFNFISSYNISGDMGYRWINFNFSSSYRTAPDIKITFNAKGMRVGEIVAVNTSGKAFELKTVFSTKHAANSGYSRLTDEQTAFGGGYSLFSSMYGDESIYATDAGKLANGEAVSNAAGSAFGKELIALGIKMFGMTPLGWRFTTALASVLIPAAMYILAKRIFKKTYLAASASVLTLISGMFITLARVANPYVFLVLFMLLSAYFMLRFTQTDINSTDRRSFIFKLVNLGLSGLFFALMFAVSWTAIFYAIMPVAMFVIYMVKATGQIKAVENSKGEVFETARSSFGKKSIAAYAVAAGSFVLMTFIVYLLTYIPVYLSSASGAGFFGKMSEDFGAMLANSVQSSKVSYAGLWIIGMGGRTLFGKSPQAVYLFANSLLVWLSLAAVVWSAVTWVRGGKGKIYRGNMRVLSVIALGLAATFVPWMFFFNGADIGNFYPALMFLILFAVLGIKNLEVAPRLQTEVMRIGTLKMTAGRILIFAAAFLTILCFAMCLPLYAGIGVGEGYFSGMYFFVK